VAGTIDEEVKNLIDRAYDRCAQILREDEAKLLEVVEFLLEHETMTGEQFVACMENKAIAEASTTALFDGFEAAESAEESGEEPIEE
jgi:cell division protease FtsH